MKIECPGCKLTGNIDDSNIPATGIAMTCPRCKHKFTVEKPSFQTDAAVAMMDNCPSCRYATFSEEKFSVCPKCGLIVADYQKKLIESRKAVNQQRPQQQSRAAAMPDEPVIFTEEERRRDEEMRRKHGLEVESDTLQNGSSQIETPLPVFIVGWGTALFAVLLAIYGFYGVIEYVAKVKEAKAAIEALENTQSPVSLFFQYMLFPSLSLLYTPVMLFFAIRFMSLKKQYVLLLQKGAWAGVVLLALMKLNDLYFWFNRSSSSASFSYSAAGLVGDLLIAVMMIAPLLALAEFFSSSIFEKIEDIFA